MSLKNAETMTALGLFLGGICAAATGVLAVTDHLTKAPIEANRLAKTNQSLAEALPPFDNNAATNTCELVSSDAEKIPVVFHGAGKNGALVGVAGVSYSAKGYAGRVEVLVGFGQDGKVRAVLVTQQNETPGLGTNVCERVRKRTIFDLLGGRGGDAGAMPPNPILDQFAGHSADSSDPWGAAWRVRKDGGTVDFVSGATVTTRAVTDAVNRISKTYADNRQEIDRKLSGPLK